MFPKQWSKTLQDYRKLQVEYERLAKAKYAMTTLSAYTQQVCHIAFAQQRNCSARWFHLAGYIREEVRFLQRGDFSIHIHKQLSFSGAAKDTNGAHIDTNGADKE